MSDFRDPEIFSLADYVAFLGIRWKSLATAVLAAAGLAALACLLLPKEYTARSVLLIEPPGGDPRTAANVSPIYLESLKSYEALAASDSLFERAALKFGLLGQAGSPPLETVKRRVLRVNKGKDTRLLEIEVTLGDPGQALAFVQYITQQTLELDEAIVRKGSDEMIEGARRDLEDAQKDLQRAQRESDAVTRSGSEQILATQAQQLADLESRTEEQRVEAKASLAESLARNETSDAAGARARLTALVDDLASIRKKLGEKSEALTSLEARNRQTADHLRAAEDRLETAQKHYDEAVAAARFRTEQLRVVDPGIAPQRPSFPNFPLAIVGATVLCSIFSLVILSAQFGLSRNQQREPRGRMKVARGGSL